MTAEQNAILLSVATTGIVGLVAALAVWALSRTRPAVAAFGAPVVVVLALAAGVAIATREMLIDDNAYQTVLVVLLAGAPLALLIGFLLALRVRAVAADAARDRADRERIHQVEESRRETIRWLSHDLRTPLAGIRALAEAGAEGASPAETGDRIVREVDRLDAMVDDIAELSRLHGTPRREVTPAPVDDLVSDAVSVVSPLAESEGVLIEAGELGGAIVAVEPREVTRAVTNIVRNAVQHSPSGGVVSVSTRTEPGRAIVDVSDSCGGIPDTDLAHVLEPGWRGDQARSERGMGLGLAIADEVARAHGGEVTVHNTPDSGGCTVRFIVTDATAETAIPQPVLTDR